MSIRVPRSRKFPPRTSQEELKAKTAEILKEKGANNHFQAQFYEATSRAVVGSKDFKFSTLQPIIKINSDKEEWQMAYDFIYDFLKKNKMDLTLSTMDVEFNLKKEKPNITNLFDGISRDQYFEDLNLQDENSKSFSKHVEDFAKENGL